MIANADSYFTIGKTHSVCQDYAITDYVDGEPFIVVCDGCSSAKDSDIGARLLALAAREILWRNHDVMLDESDFLYRIALRAESSCLSLRMPLDCISATMLSARYRNGAIHTRISGDGVEIARERTGRINVIHYEYPSGAPFYLRYLLHPEDVQCYINEFGFHRKQTYYAINADETVEQLSQWETKDENNFYGANKWDIKDYDLVALLSDGVHSFIQPEVTATSKMEKSVPFIEIVKELMKFKNYSGIFVERRVKRAFDQKLGAFGKGGWMNTDDLAMAAIWVGE